MARLLVLKTAWLMDTVGNQHARIEISGIKFAVPEIALRIVDRAIQIHGGAGVSDDFPLAYMYAHLRTLRLADGPDEVHKLSLARQELRRQRERRGALNSYLGRGACAAAAGPIMIGPAGRNMFRPGHLDPQRERHQPP